MGIVRSSYVRAPAKALAASLFFVVACSGSAFEQGSPTGSALGGAAGAAGASSIGTGGSSMPSGAAGVGGKLTSTAGRGGAGGELEPGAAGAGEPAAGAGGAVDQPPPLTACDRAGWKLTAFASSEKATELPAAALDGSLDTRWSSGVPRAVGQWLELELGAGQAIGVLELRTPAYAADVPSSLVVKLDGQKVAAHFATPSSGVLRVSFEARAATLVRLELDAQALPWWSVSELDGLCR